MVYVVRDRGLSVAPFNNKVLSVAVSYANCGYTELAIVQRLYANSQLVASAEMKEFFFPR